MNWQILVLVSVLAGSVCTLMQKRFADKKVDPVAFAILEQLFGGIMIALFAFVTGSLNFDGIIHYWPNLIAMVVLWSGFNVLNIMALCKVQASHFMILFQTRVFWTLLVVVLVMRAPFTVLNLMGVILVITAILIAIPKERFGRLTRGDLYVFLAALCFGLGVGNDAYVLKGIASPVSYTIITMLTPPILLTAVFPKALGKMDFVRKSETLKPFILLTFLASLALVCVYMAYKIGNPALIAPLTQTSAIVTVVLSIIFLGERDRPWAKLLAIAVSFAGVLLLI